MACALVALALAGCKKDEPKPAETKAQTDGAGAKPPATAEKKKADEKKAEKADRPKFVPLEWDDPKSWKKVEPSSRMRRASYEIPAAPGDEKPAELNVFILGGEIEPNIKRWVGEFSNFDVKDVVRVDRTVGGLQQAVVEVPKGDFSGGMGSKEGGKNYGLLGAIAVSPSGAKYFFKMTGPSKTVTSARDAFYGLLDSLRIEGAKPGGVTTGAAATPKAGDPPAKASASGTGESTPPHPAAKPPAKPASH